MRICARACACARVRARALARACQLARGHASACSTCACVIVGGSERGRVGGLVAEDEDNVFFFLSRTSEDNVFQNP